MSATLRRRGASAGSPGAQLKPVPPLADAAAQARTAIVAFTPSRFTSLFGQFFDKQISFPEARVILPASSTAWVSVGLCRRRREPQEIASAQWAVSRDEV